MKQERQKAWINLKDGLCPGCSYKLKVVGLLDPVFHCTNCTFKISDWKFKEIMSKLILNPRSIRQGRDTLAELNNLNIEGDKLNDWGTEENDAKYETEEN